MVRMERAHIRCIPFNPVVPLLSLVMNHRDHRKIVVIDGTVAYTGGVNLADEYINAEQPLRLLEGRGPACRGRCGVELYGDVPQLLERLPPQRDGIMMHFVRMPAGAARYRTASCSPTRTARWTRNRWPRRCT